MENLKLPIALDKFIEYIGRCPATIWRWRKRGWLKTVNIAGRQYLTPEALSEFNRRMQAGEFAQTPKTPSQKQGGHNVSPS